MAKAVVTLYGDDASVYGSLVLTQVPPAIRLSSISLYI
jgi:hypothetical protein